jgi:hypothetical protein
MQKWVRVHEQIQSSGSHALVDHNERYGGTGFVTAGRASLRRDGLRYGGTGFCVYTPTTVDPEYVQATSTPLQP